MSSGYSYNTYVNWDIWVPIGVSSLSVILTVILVIISIIWLKFYRSSAHHFIEFTYQLAKLVLRDSLQRNLEAVPPRMTLYDRRVSPILVILLSSITPAVFIPAFVSFWASFLVEETYACDPGLDCFSLDPASFSAKNYQQPISNCTNHENTTIICFQFVFDYTAGFATTGGILVVAVVSLKVYGVLLVWLVGLAPSSRSSRKGRCYSCRTLCSIVSVFIFFLAPIIIAIVILITVFLLSLPNDIVFQSNERIVKFAAYCSSLLFVGPVAGVCILTAVIGSRLRRVSYDVSDTDRDRRLEAGFSESFNMSATNLRQQPSHTVTSKTTNLNSFYTTGVSMPQPVINEPDEPDLSPPQLVGSVLSSYHDVTSLPPHHSESSFLLTGAKSSSYQTT